MKNGCFRRCQVTCIRFPQQHSVADSKHSSSTRGVKGILHENSRETRKRRENEMTKLTVTSEIRQISRFFSSCPSKIDHPCLHGMSCGCPWIVEWILLGNTNSSYEFPWFHLTKIAPTVLQEHAPYSSSIARLLIVIKTVHPNPTFASSFIFHPLDLFAM